MDRTALIERLVPQRRFHAAVAPMCPMRSGKFLFAATDTNAGYFLLTDQDGRLADLDVDMLGEVVQEAKTYGIKLRNMRIFGKGSAIKRIPGGGRFYNVSRLEGRAA